MTSRLLLLKSANITTLMYRIKFEDFLSILSGCVFGEMLTSKPLFGGGGDGDMSVVSNIIELVGTPREEFMPGFNDSIIAKVYDLKVQPYNLIGRMLENTFRAAIEPLVCMLRYNAKNRPSATKCKGFKFFQEVPLACDNNTLKVHIEMQYLSINDV